MWTSPVPVSIATNDAAATLPVRSIHGWRYSRPTRWRPGARPTSRAPWRLAVVTKASASLAATTSVSPPWASATYASSGGTATARFAGSVHAVVVQITREGAGAFGAAGSAPTSGNLT